MNNKNFKIYNIFSTFHPIDNILIYPLINKLSYFKILLNIKSDEIFFLFILGVIIYNYILYQQKKEIVSLIITLIYLIIIIDDIYYLKINNINISNNKYNELILRLFTYNISSICYSFINNNINYNILFNIIIFFIIYYNILINKFKV